MREPRFASIASAGADWSLQHRLPLLISLLVACVVGGFSLAAYREVRNTTISRGTDRLERVGRELTTSSARTTAARSEALRTLAADSVLTRAVAGEVAPALIGARLEARRRPGDSLLVGWQLTSLPGRTLFRSPIQTGGRDSAELASAVARAVGTRSGQRSVLYRSGDDVRLWTVAPVLVEGRVVGTLAELRRLGKSNRIEEMIRELIGDDVRLLYGSRGSAEWASPGGRMVPAPFDPPTVEGKAVLVKGHDGAGYYAVQSAVPTTPLLVVLLQSEASMLRRPQQFLRAMLGVGVVLLVLATVAAWLLTRHVTRPLRDITQAASALARGDYAQRVRVSGGGGDELAGLATTFNVMAEGIGDAHASLAERNQALHRANAAKAQFLAMMSHELRTPLNAIGGFTELIELGLRGPVTSEQIEDLGRIRRNKDHLLSIISDILNFARADAGSLSLTLVPVPLGTVLADAVDELGHQIARRSVRVRLDRVPDDAIVLGDREKLQQIATNLLSNALKFTEPGGQVVVSTVVLHHAIRVDVHDTGEGIEPAMLDDIFEPFVQADASLTRRAGGTGLGLTIARHLATAMGGSLTVTSTPAQGSTFSVTLARAEPRGVAMPERAAGPHARGEPAPADRAAPGGTR